MATYPNGLIDVLFNGFDLQGLLLFVNRMVAGRRRVPMPSRVGLFFAISGFHKLFFKQRHEALVETLKDDKIPFVGLFQWFVPSQAASSFSAALPLLRVSSHRWQRSEF